MLLVRLGAVRSLLGRSGSLITVRRKHAQEGGEVQHPLPGAPHSVLRRRSRQRARPFAFISSLCRRSSHASDREGQCALEMPLRVGTLSLEARRGECRFRQLLRSQREPRLLTPTPTPLPA